MKSVLSAGVLVLYSMNLLVGARNPAWKIPETTPGNEALGKYFALETRKLEGNSLVQVKTKSDWERERPIRVKQLKEMLGVPEPNEKSALQAKITGKVEHEEFTVENLHFQSLPGLYVTGNLYVPKIRKGKLPAILYVCGHGRVKVDGVSMGNKTHYQHHGAWFARHGYICLTIDTIQLGEIEGYHHGTYHGNRMWWISRGYTPAGVEAWNGIRAIDYLQSRSEVDGNKIGVTGRSGGGAYSWWISALDERVKVSVPVAGIANLKNHVMDGCVEGHCDCMFMVNTHRWDYADVAALVAPRKLLISNTDNDPIFPLDGVVQTFEKAQHIYNLMGVGKNIGLHITEGPHQDTQPLRMGAFHWFDKHLKGESRLITKPAEKVFEPKELKVFEKLPEDERTSAIDETFVQSAKKFSMPNDQQDWDNQRKVLLEKIRLKSFGGWPKEDSIETQTKRISQAVHEGIRFTEYQFIAQEPFELPLYLFYRDGLEPEDLDLVVLNVLDEAGWQNFLAWANVGFSKPLDCHKCDSPMLNQEDWDLQKEMFQNFKWGMAYVAPRGVGPTHFTDNARKHIQIQRRFYLLGQTLEGMQTWDIRQSVKALRQIKGMQKPQLWIQGEGQTAGCCLYAALFEKDIHRVDLHNLPSSHSEGPHFLNILRHTDIAEIIAHLASHSQVRIYQESQEGWEYAEEVAQKLKWDTKQFKVVTLEK